METTAVADRILEIVRSGTTAVGRMAAHEALRSFQPSELFATLFPISVLAQGGKAPVALAGCALEVLNPPCPLPLSEAMDRLLTAWDISLEEVVFYLAKQFGTEKVVQLSMELQTRAAEAEQSARLRAIAYWAGVFESRRSDEQVQIGAIERLLARPIGADRGSCATFADLTESNLRDIGRLAHMGAKLYAILYIRLLIRRGATLRNAMTFLDRVIVSREVEMADWLENYFLAE